MSYGGYELVDPKYRELWGVPPNEGIYIRRRPKTKAEGRRISAWQEFLKNSGEFKAFIDEMSKLYRQQYPGRQPLGTWQKFLRDHGMKELMDKLSAEYRGQAAPTPAPAKTAGTGIYSGGRRRYVRY